MSRIGRGDFAVTSVGIGVDVATGDNIVSGFQSEVVVRVLRAPGGVKDKGDGTRK